MRAPQPVRFSTIAHGNSGWRSGPTTWVWRCNAIAVPGDSTTAINAGAWLAAHPFARPASTLTMWTFADGHYKAYLKSIPAFEAALKANHVSYQMFTYPGTQHGFNNDTTPRYDKAAAALAWQRTMDFFKKNLRG